MKAMSDVSGGPGWQRYKNGKWYPPAVESFDRQNGWLRPSSLKDVNRTQWSLWVLDNGLPELPDSIERGECVPVACWNGSRFGAVVHIERATWGFPSPPEPPPPPPPGMGLGVIGPTVVGDLVSTVQVLRRTPTGWEVAKARGGAGWSEPELVPSDMPEGTATFRSSFYARPSSEWSCKAKVGAVGRGAFLVEIKDAEGTTRRPVDSPLGLFVTAFDGAMAATIRVLDGEGSVLDEDQYVPVVWHAENARRCPSCRHRIDPGEFVVRKGRRVVHVDCIPS